MSLLITQVCEKQNESLKSFKEVIDFYVLEVAINAKSQEVANQILFEKLSELYENMKASNAKLREICETEVQ